VCGLTGSDVVDRPKKRARALLLPPGEGDAVPDANKFKYKSKGRTVGGDAEANGYRDEEETPRKDSIGTGAAEDGASDDAEKGGEEGEEDDEFAALVSWRRLDGFRADVKLHAETD
jgi:hypothetical protein